MSSQWVNKYAIMRDLSLAQGCVPVDVACAVGAGDKPPTENFKEETEEEFYRHWIGGDGDFEAPDLGLINQMLEVVRNHDVTSNVEGDTSDPDHIIQISKLNPHCAEFKPRALKSSSKHKKNPPKPIKASPAKLIKENQPELIKEKPKIKKQRNAAIQSLLQYENENLQESNAQKLLKPIDFISNNTIESVKKVTDWLVSKCESPSHSKSPNHANESSRRNTLQLALDPSSMFKKKNIPDNASPKPNKEIKKTSPHKYRQFVPSQRATEYYKKFMENSKMKEIVQEDVWTKVERQMKEIDERRKAEAELRAMSLALYSPRPADEPAAPSAPDPVLEILQMVQLPQHRHLLETECKVCSIMNREKTNDRPSNADNTTLEDWRKKPNEDAHTKTSPPELKSVEEDYDDMNSWRNEILDIGQFVEFEPTADQFVGHEPTIGQLIDLELNVNQFVDHADNQIVKHGNLDSLSDSN